MLHAILEQFLKRKLQIVHLYWDEVDTCIWYICCTVAVTCFPCVHYFVCCLENFLYLFSSSLELSPWWKADAWNVCFETLYGGKFTIPTQLIIFNCPVILSQRRDSAVSLENYPLFLSLFRLGFMAHVRSALAINPSGRHAVL